jgi:hypothetical protein
VFGRPALPYLHCPTEPKKASQSCPVEKLDSSFAPGQGWTRPKSTPRPCPRASLPQGSRTPTLTFPSQKLLSLPHQLSRPHQLSLHQIPPPPPNLGLRLSTLDSVASLPGCAGKPAAGPEAASPRPNATRRSATRATRRRPDATRRGPRLLDQKPTAPPRPEAGRTSLTKLDPGRPLDSMRRRPPRSTPPDASRDSSTGRRRARRPTRLTLAAALDPGCRLTLVPCSSRRRRRRSAVEPQQGLDCFFLFF